MYYGNANKIGMCLKNIFNFEVPKVVIALAALKKDPYQHMKLLETRRNWASSGKYIENSVILRGH